jgi:hypothetical protein
MKLFISGLSYNGANEKFCGTCKAAPSGNFLRLSPPDCVVLESLVITVKIMGLLSDCVISAQK